MTDVTALGFAPTEEKDSTTELDIRDGIVEVSELSVSLTEPDTPTRGSLDAPEPASSEDDEPAEDAPAGGAVDDLAEDADPSATIDPRHARDADTADPQGESADADVEVAATDGEATATDGEATATDGEIAAEDAEVAATDGEATAAEEPTPHPVAPHGAGAQAPSLTQTWHPGAAAADGAAVIEDTANAETIIRRKGNAPAEPDAQLLGDHDGHTIVVPASRRRGAERDTLESTRRPTRPAARHGRLRLSTARSLTLTERS